MRNYILVGIPLIAIGFILYSQNEEPTSELAPEQVPTYELVEEIQEVSAPKQDAPVIVVPDNFVMETKVYFQQRDGSIYDSMTKTTQYFDTDGNRYRNNFIDASGKIVESEVSLFNDQYKLKSTVGQECQRYFHPTQMSLKHFLTQAFDETAGFFQYIGIDYPEFDSQKVYYKFTNGGDDSATTYFFD